MAKILNKEAPPFPLTKPNQDTYLASAEDLGYGNGSVKDALDNAVGKTDGISKESTQSEEEALVFTTDGGTQVGKIDPTGADFNNLKRGGQQVARMSDLPTKDSSIGENPSTTNVPTTKAVKDYVDANSGGNYPIETESTSSDTEEQVWGNNAETQEYAKIGSYGMKSKAYLDMQGNNVIPAKDTSIGSTPSQTNVPTTKAVKDYVDANSGLVNLPISEETVSSDTEEVLFGNYANTDTYAKIDSEGVKAKGYFDMNGNPLETGSSEFKNNMYVAAGDSITEGAGLKRTEDSISSSDTYKPVSGTAKKTYPYYIAKYNKMQWVNQGKSGSTLGDVTAIGLDRNGFSKANGRYTQLPNDINYLSLWFGWNDDYYGPIMKREDWLYSTYGSKIYWPTSASLIGTTHTDGTPYATQSQYDACNAVTGSVGGVEYNTSSQYFAALYRGLETDTTNQTWWGAFNIVLPYLIEKYPFAKILVITGYGGTAPMWDIAIAAAKKYGVAWLDLSQPEMNFINVRNNSDEANGLVYFDATKYTDRNVYASYSSGDIPAKTLRYRTLLYDGCHPNYRGYEYLYNRIQEKLLNI